jgi:hypothetical protein
MNLTSQARSGVRSVSDPTWWIVPPWSVDASLADMVAHFLRHWPWEDASNDDRLAFFQAYAAALEMVPENELTDSFRLHWYEGLRDCIGRCLAAYEDTHHTSVSTPHPPCALADQRYEKTAAGLDKRVRRTPRGEA